MVGALAFQEGRYSKLSSSVNGFSSGHFIRVMSGKPTSVHHSHIQYVVSLKGFGPVSIKDGSSVSLSYNIR